MYFYYSEPTPIDLIQFVMDQFLLIRQLLLLATIALILRWCVSLSPHSGQSQPPMYGDFEAQRHWMEITYHVPPGDWYRDTPDNRLQYWGLDYPPLSAYHSWLCGAIAHNLVDASYVELHGSRGLESEPVRRYMRATVLAADLLLLVPAAIVVAWSLYASDSGVARSSSAVLACVGSLLLGPPLILIDHGHFQYNGVSLALCLLAVAAAGRGRQLLTALCFSLALNHKQMELYHALPFFCYLLADSWRAARLQSETGWMAALIGRIAALGTVVISVFAALWLPLVLATPGGGGIATILTRLFPFERGVFEDKVANFWCTVSLVYKVQHQLARPFLIKLCLSLTALALAPSNYLLLRQPTILNLRYALVNTSLAFFLFAYHVHEKSILLAVLPAALLFVETPLPVLWFTVTASFSLLPLLARDSLLLPLLALVGFYTVATSWMAGVLQPTAVYRTARRRSLMTCARASARSLDWHVVARLVAISASLCGYLVLTALSLCVSPPERYPDLWPVLFGVYSFLHFVGFFIYFHLLQYRMLDEKLKIA